MTLDETIKHYEELAEEKEDFDKFQCGYCKPGCEDGVWKNTCRLPSNVPTGCSWGECSEQNCPLFPVYLEYASDHRQLAEWLKELKRLREQTRWIPCSERMPEEDGCYLVTTTGTNNDIIDIAYYTEGIWRKASQIKAWMPLPKPYVPDKMSER